MNKTELACALGERTGYDLRPKDVRRAGRWVFVRTPEYPDEVECYALPLPMSAEPWTDVMFERSPFAGREAWALVADEVLNCLDIGWLRHLVGRVGDDVGRVGEWQWLHDELSEFYGVGVSA